MIDSATGDSLKKWIRESKAAIDTSMDPVVVLNPSRQIVYYNVFAKNFFELSARALGKQPEFCSLVEISECRDKCCMKDVLNHGSSLKLAEVPGKKQNEKIRLSIRAIPIYEGSKASKPIGAIVSLRDTSGEIVLQAKYHKLLEILEDKKEQLEEMEDRLREFRASLRRTRSFGAGRG